MLKSEEPNPRRVRTQPPERGFQPARCPRERLLCKKSVGNRRSGSSAWQATRFRSRTLDLSRSKLRKTLIRLVVVVFDEERHIPGQKFAHDGDLHERCQFRVVAGCGLPDGQSGLISNLRQDFSDVGGK